MATNSDNPEEFRIGDPEEISQKTRIQELLSRRSGVIDSRDAAVDAVKFGQADERTAREFYQSRIESLVIDLWTKFESSDLETGEEYLKAAEIDTFTVEPPSELIPSDRADMAAGEDLPDAKEYTIEGLEWFIENDAVIEVPFTAYTWNPPGEKTVPSKVLIPWETLDRGLIMCMKFIDETGIDADLEGMDREAVGEYADILEEDVE